MSDTITQTRLSKRLDNYLSEYTSKNVRKASLSKNVWEKVWQLADVARIHNILTPELVDDVRIALHNL